MHKFYSMSVEMYK